MSDLFLGFLRDNFSYTHLFRGRLPALMARTGQANWQFRRSWMFSCKCWVCWSHCFCSDSFEWLTQFLVYPRMHPKTHGEEFLLPHSDVTPLWSLLHATVLLRDWICPSGSVSFLCVLTHGRGGVGWSPQSLGQSTAPSPGAAAQVMPELEGCQFSSCASTAQLKCHHHLGTVTSPYMSALICSRSQVMSHASCKMSERHLCGFLFPPKQEYLIPKCHVSGVTSHLWIENFAYFCIVSRLSLGCSQDQRPALLEAKY